MRAFGVIILLYAGFIFAIFLYGSSKLTPILLVNMAISLFGIVAALGLCFGIRGALPAALIFTGLFIGEWVILFFVRVGFVIVNGGMDRADGYGSPMVFLLGAIFELVFLAIPSIIIGLILFHIWRLERNWKTKDKRLTGKI